MDCSPPGSSARGIFHGVGCHARLQGIPDSRIEPASLVFPALAGGFFTTSATWEAHNQNDSVLTHLFDDIRKLSPQNEALLSSFEVIIIKL